MHKSYKPLFLSLLVMDFTNNIITNILTAAITEIFSLAIKKYIIDKKWRKFKFTFLKKKRLVDNSLSIPHPNTRFTFDENHNFVDHL